MGRIVAGAIAVVAAGVAFGQAEQAGDASLGGAIVVVVMAVVAAACVWLLWKLGVVRPGSLGWAARDRKPVSRDAAIPLFLLAMGLFLTPQLLGGVIAVASGAAQPGTEGEASLRTSGVYALGYYASGVCIAAIALWIAARTALQDAAEIVPRWRDLWVGAFAMLLAYPIIWVVAALAQAVIIRFTGEPESTLQHGTLELLTGEAGPASVWWWAVLLGAVVGAPIVEEVIFRGLLQSALVATVGRWAGLLLAAAGFTLLHVPTGPEAGGATWLAIPTLAVLSVSLGIARERTGRLGVPIVMHIAFNALNVGLAFVATASP